MPKITKIIRTETGHRLTEYVGRCAHIHGHSYEWHVTVEGPAVDNGMVMDFKDLKKILKETIDTLDHAFVMYDEDPLVHQCGRGGVAELFKPAPNIVPRMHFVSFNPTVENLVSWQFNIIKKLLPENIRLVSIKCWETADSFCEVTKND